MEQEQSDLIGAFREDHALLGRGFHEISVCLRAKSFASASSWARKLDRQAGPHIAFEEEHFYPALVPVVGKADVNRLYREHKEGLDVVRQLSAAAGPTPLPERQRQALLSKSENMERHIAECGELFEAIGRMPKSEQEKLCRQLLRLRKERPGWIDYADRASVDGHVTVQPG